VRLVGTLVGALIGGVVGYFIGVFVACDWLYPNSNLCGIWGVFLTGPIGSLVGAVIGWVRSRPPRR
jgi:hypothetical protein